MLTSDSVNLNIIVAYRSPNTTASNSEKLCNIIRSIKENTVVIGDINLLKVNWELQTADTKGQSFLEASLENFLTQLIDFPTHSKYNFHYY